MAWRGSLEGSGTLPATRPPAWAMLAAAVPSRWVGERRPRQLHSWQSETQPCSKYVERQRGSSLLRAWGAERHSDTHVQLVLQISSV